MRIIVSGQGSWRYVDCVAIRAGKLEALEYVRLMYGVPLNRCVAAGDSGNDILMLEGAASSSYPSVLYITVFYVPLTGAGIIRLD